MQPQRLTSLARNTIFTYIHCSFMNTVIKYHFLTYKCKKINKFMYHKEKRGFVAAFSFFLHNKIKNTISNKQNISVMFLITPSK